MTLLATPKDQVFLDPSEKQLVNWRVFYNGKITSPSFNSKGAAEAYLDIIRKGIRKPEYN